MQTKSEKAKYNQEWKKKHPDKVKQYKEHFYKNNPKANKEYRIKSLKSWETVISEKTFCQMCGRDIYFNKGNFKNAIHFDHRNEGREVIKDNPTIWLRNHHRTLLYEKIWNSCNWGLLCSDCNRCLPSFNRKSFVINAVKYILGENIQNVLIKELFKNE